MDHAIRLSVHIYLLLPACSRSFSTCHAVLHCTCSEGKAAKRKLWETCTMGKVTIAVLIVCYTTLLLGCTCLVMAFDGCLHLSNCTSAYMLLVAETLTHCMMYAWCDARSSHHRIDCGMWHLQTCHAHTCADWWIGLVHRISRSRPERRLARLDALAPAPTLSCSRYRMISVTRPL